MSPTTKANHGKQHLTKIQKITETKNMSTRFLGFYDACSLWQESPNADLVAWAGVHHYKWPNMIMAAQFQTLDNDIT